MHKHYLVYAWVLNYLVRTLVFKRNYLVIHSVNHSFNSRKSNVCALLFRRIRYYCFAITSLFIFSFRHLYLNRYHLFASIYLITILASPTSALCYSDVSGIYTLTGYELSTRYYLCRRGCLVKLAIFAAAAIGTTHLPWSLIT